jgi:hypothetical protein
MPKKKTWNSIKDSITKEPTKDLIKLIKELYELNEQNCRILDTRFSNPKDQLERYKKIIRRGVYPDAVSEERFDIKSARRAIVDFKKASNNEACILELMFYYIEQGNECTLDYGDLNGSFYTSLMCMFDEIIKQLKKSSPETLNHFLPRLRKVVKQADDIAWGYSEYIAETSKKAFPET